MWEINSYKAHEDHMMLYEALEKSMNHDHTNELLKDLAEARKKKKKRRDSPKMPPGSPPHQPPPPPPPVGPSGTSRSPGAFRSSQVPPLPPSTNQEGQSHGSTATSSSKTAASAKYKAWTTTDTRLRTSISSTLEDLHIDDDMAPDVQVHSSNDEDIRNAHIPKVNLRQDWWKPLEETDLLHQNLPGPVFELVKVFHPNVIHLQYQMEECHKLLTNSVDDLIIRHNVSKPLPPDGPPSQVTIQSDFFFKKDLEYLRYSSKGGRPALSILKMKAAYYLDVGLEQMVPDQMWIEEECKHTSKGDRKAVWNHMRILSVVKIEVFSMYGYDYMKKIVLRRADLNEHIIAKRDFKYLYPSDFEDLYLLNLQDRSNEFMFAIQKRLKTRRIFWNLESFVGGRVRDRDYRLLKDISFGDLFFSDKPLDIDKNAETKVESMVNVSIQQALSSISLMTSPIIDLTTRPESPKLFKALKKSMNCDHSEELAQDLVEAFKKKKKSRESPKTPSGSLPHHRHPPPPPPAGPSRDSGTPGASGSSQVPPPPHPPSSISLTPADLEMDADMAPDEQAQSSDNEDIGSAYIPTASALASNYSPPPEDSLLVQTGDIATLWTSSTRDEELLSLNLKTWKDLRMKSLKSFIQIKPLPLGGPPGQVIIQSDFFFNKDLEYLKYGSKGRRPALSISKMKAAYYLDAGLKQMVPDQFWIDDEYKYDIAAMYGHLNHLPPKDKKILTTAVNQWTRHLVIRQRVEDFQLGIESYQTQLNLTKPQWDATGFEYKHDYTVIDSPRAVMFQEKYEVQMMMRFNEIHKFSDGTLQQINEALYYRVKEFRINRMNPGLNTRFWTRKDVDRCKAFMFTIQRRLRTRRIFRNLESFVGGRVREGDYILLMRTE
nr:hypothetical protein [Tanacetum cinerariifolium]